MDNIDNIKKFINPIAEDDYYYLQILRRKKDNPDNTSNTRVIKDYFIRNLEELEKNYTEIKELCNFFNARAGLRLNKRSFKKTSLMAIEIMIKNGIMEGWEHSKRAYASAAGKHHNEKNKSWIVDIDNNPSLEEIDDIKHIIRDCQPEGNKIKETLATKTGYHLITSPFNLKQFKEAYPEIDIHKDNPVNLYIPEAK